MNKKIIIAGVALLLLAGGALAFKSISGKKASGNPEPNAAQSTTSQMSESAEFARAIESGKPTVCELTKGTDSMEYKIKGKMMRLNYTTSLPDAKTGSPTTGTSHMINDTAFIYSWADGQKQAGKFPVTATVPSAPVASAPSKGTTPSFNSESDYNSLKDQGYTINCHSGNISDADFVPPADVTFTDFSTVQVQPVPSVSAGSQIDVQKLQEQFGSMSNQDN